MTTAVSTAEKPATTTKKETTMAKATKPVMAANKPFVLPPIESVDEVPVPVRTGRTAPLPIDFDGMEAAFKKTKKASKRFIPVAFWEARGISGEKLTAAANKDRLRRSFYNWQGDDRTRKGYAVAFSDQYDNENGTYTGVNIYFQVRPS